MTRADALRTLFLAPLGALFGAIARRKPEPAPLIFRDNTVIHTWDGHAEHVALVADEASEVGSGAFFLAQDGPWVLRDDGNFDYLRTRPRDGYFASRALSRNDVRFFDDPR